MAWLHSRGVWGLCAAVRLTLACAFFVFLLTAFIMGDQARMDEVAVEIKAVCAKLEEVEVEIKQARAEHNDKEVAALRKEKEQLRTEKEQLRTKELLLLQRQPGAVSS